MRRQTILIILASLFLLAGSACAQEKPQSGSEVFIDLGIRFYDKMQYGKAEEYFKEAKRQKPDRRQKKFLAYAIKTLEIHSKELARIEGLNNRLQDGRGADKNALTGELISAHLDLGAQLLKKDGYVAIIKSHFDYIISQDPVNLEAYLYLGNINYLGMAYDEAIKNYKKALELDPDNPFFAQRLGDIYVGIGNYDEAGKCYAEAVRLFKRSRLEDKKEKIGYLKKLSGKLPTALDDIKSLMDKKSYGDVITLCKKRIALNPSDVTAITYMGMAMEELGQWQQAELLYKTAIKRNPDYPTPHFHLARIYLLKRKDADKAITEIEIFKEGIRDLLDKDKQAKDGLIAAEHTLVYIYHEILRDYKTAIRESKYLLELAPDDQEAHYNLALSYTYLDKKAMAYEELKKVIAINPENNIAKAAKDTIKYLQSSPSARSLPYRQIEE